MSYAAQILLSSPHTLASFELSMGLRAYAVGFLIFVVAYVMLIRMLWEHMALFALKFFEMIGVESEFVIRASIAALIVVAFFTPPGLIYLMTKGPGGLFDGSGSATRQLTEEEITRYRGAFVSPCTQKCREEGGDSRCATMCNCLWDHIASQPEVATYLDEPEVHESTLTQIVEDGVAACVPEDQHFELEPITARSISEGQSLEEFYASADKKGGVGGWYPSDKKGYEEHCSGCHDIGLVGAPKLGDKDRWKSILEERNRHDLVNNAVKGKGGHPKLGGCDTCTVDGIGAMTAYMLEQAE